MGHTENISLDKLIEGCRFGLCHNLIAELNDDNLHALFHTLTMERMVRKAFDIETIYKDEGYCWSQTLYHLTLRYLLGKPNRNMATRLAKLIPHNVLMRENNALYKIEALLLGGAGLLDLYNDSYAVDIKQEFQHLASKYNIKPLNAHDWRLSGIHINNHPTLRLAQLAACIHNNSISISGIMSCKGDRDIHALFSCSASDYWVDRLMSESFDRSISAKIGSTMSNIIAINAIIPVLVAYSNYTESHNICEKAINLLYNIRAEDNTYTRQWQYNKQIAKSAFDSQALIQLSTEYCNRGRCKECPLAKILTITKGNS
jgi:hypothetical protein